MSYVGIEDDMEDIWVYVSYLYLEEDQVQSRTPESESDYDPTMPMPHTRVSADEEPFEYGEEPNEDE